MNFHSILGLIAACAVSATAYAHDYTVKDVHITHPYARATVPHQPSGAAYLTLENQGSDTDALLSAESPVAKMVQIHSMSMEGNVMRMREVGSIELKPSEKVEMKPGHGYHIMMMGLQQPLKAGDTFPLTLTFEKAGKIEVLVKVEGMSGMQEKHKGQSHGQ